MTTQKSLSVVVPIYNEAGNITKLHEEIVKAVEMITATYEIIYINDQSTDKSLAELKSLKGATIITLARRYGQSTALDAGFKAAKNEVIVTLDGDGQNDPADIGPLLTKMEKERLDVVAGWRKDRKDRGGIIFITLIARALRKLIIHDRIHDSGCTLRVYTAEAVKNLDLQGEMHRYIIALLRWRGFSIGEEIVNDRPRLHGISKYGYGKAVRGFIDLLYIWFIHKYSQRPLHLFGYISLSAFALGILSLLWTIYEKLVFNLSFNRNGWFFLSGFFFLAAILLFSFGIVIDLLIRIYLNTSPSEKRYYIRKREETSCR